jgi:hypothetical protein
MRRSPHRELQTVELTPKRRNSSITLVTPLS